MAAVGWPELGRRISSARERRSLSQGGLAEIAGLNQSAVSRIEAGKRPVSSLELVDIAAALHVSVLDLLEERPRADLAVAARVAEASRPASVERALTRARDILGIQQLLDGLDVTDDRPRSYRCELPVGSPSLQGGRLASQVRVQLGLKHEPIMRLPDLVEERLAADVALEPMPEGVDGLILATDRSALILVDSDPVYGRQRFTIAHELCHHICGDAEPSLVDEGLGFTSNLAREQRANSFAASFLMPIEGIRARLDGRPIDEEAVIDLTFEYGISLEAFTWHAHKAHLIDREFGKYLRAAGPKQLAFKHGHVADWEETQRLRRIIRPPAHLLRRAFEAYQLGKIGIGPIAVLMLRNDPEALRAELAASGISPHLREVEDSRS